MRFLRTKQKEKVSITEEELGNRFETIEETEKQLKDREDKLKGNKKRLETLKKQQEEYVEKKILAENLYKEECLRLEKLEEEKRLLEERMQETNENLSSSKQYLEVTEKELKSVLKTIEKVESSLKAEEEKLNEDVLSHVNEVENFQKDAEIFEKKEKKKVREEKETKVIEFNKVVSFIGIDKIKENIIKMSDSPTRHPSLTIENEEIFFKFSIPYVGISAEGTYVFKVEEKKKSLKLYQLYQGVSLIEIGYETKDGLVLETKTVDEEGIKYLLKIALESTTFITKQVC